MLNIQINKDIDRFKKEFWKGLSFKECISAAGALVVMAGIAVLAYTYGGLGTEYAVYLGIPFAAPVALNGFYQKNNMSFGEVIKRYLASIFSKPLTYISKEYYDYYEYEKRLFGPKQEEMLNAEAGEENPKIK